MSSVQSTTSSKARLLHVVTPNKDWKLSSRARAFFAVALTSWNQLPEELCLAPSLQMFRRLLKTLLFREALHSDPGWLYVSCPAIVGGLASGAIWLYAVNCLIFFCLIIGPARLALMIDMTQEESRDLYWRRNHQASQSSKGELCATRAIFCLPGFYAYMNWFLFLMFICVY